MLRVSLLFVFAALGAAEVEEVTNQAQFQKILANNAAVAVDFLRVSDVLNLDLDLE